MTRHTVDTITSDALDQLHAEIDRLTAELADYDQRARQLEGLLGVAHQTSNRSEAERTRAAQRAEQLAVAVARAHHVADLIDAGAPWTVSHHDTANRIREALDGEQAIEPALAATDTATTTRVFAALHRSAEEDVTRVIALHERWVKAGPPPLGTIVARWWDARLVELHDAIRPPASQTQEQP